MSGARAYLHIDRNENIISWVLSKVYLKLLNSTKLSKIPVSHLRRIWLLWSLKTKPFSDNHSKISSRNIYFMGKEGNLGDKKKHFPRVEVIDWNDSLELPLAVLTTKLSTGCLYGCPHSSPLTLRSLSKAKRKIASPHTALLLTATMKESGWLFLSEG